MRYVEMIKLMKGEASTNTFKDRERKVMKKTLRLLRRHRNVFFLVPSKCGIINPYTLCLPVHPKHIRLGCPPT